MGALQGAASAYQSAYTANNRFMGFKDPAWAAMYKGPEQAARWQRRESQYGAYPELARTEGRGGLALLTGDVAKTLPSTQIYTPQLERYMADPLAENSTAMAENQTAQAARYGGRYNLGPEGMIAASQGISEADRNRTADARRQARLTSVIGNREEAKSSLGLGEDLFDKRQGQMSANENTQASGMASYYTALRQEELLRMSTSAANRSAMIGAGVRAATGFAGGFMPAA